MSVVIDESLCVGCGQCVMFCPAEALTALWGICEVKKDECTHCLICMSHCPSDAIKEGKKDGEI
jgi:Pyruvate/2-oxoacid:ferredoxin oxidoreductase delta subunit